MKNSLYKLLYILFLIQFLLLYYSCNNKNREQVDNNMFFPKTRYVDTVPFSFKFNESAIVLKARIKKCEYNFVFDTGASGTVINIDIPANRENINKESITDIIGRKYSADLVTVDTLRVGNILSFNHLCNKKTLNGIDGILGGDFLKHFVWKIDFAHKRIEIAKNVDVFPGLYTGVDFQIRNNMPFLHCKINGRELELGLDVGFSGFCQVHSNQFDSIGKNSKIIKWQGLNYSPNYNIFGNDTIERIINWKNTITTLEIGEELFCNETIVLKKQLNSQLNNLLGIDFCKRFSYIVVDYPAQKLYFGKRLYKSLRYFENVKGFVNTLGLGISKKDVPYISQVVPSYFNGNISLRDTVVKINGISILGRDSSFYKDKFIKEKNSARYVPSEYRKILNQFLFVLDTATIEIKRGDSTKSIQLRRNYNLNELPDTIHNFQIRPYSSHLFKKGYRIKKDFGEYYIYLVK